MINVLIEINDLFDKRVYVYELLKKIVLLEKDKVYLYIENSFSIEYPILEKRISILATLSTVLPLLGLLGTVIGIMDAFLYIGNDDLDYRLWDSIFYALSTTAFSLFITIPSLLAYNYLIYKIDFIFSKIKLECLDLTDFR